jgi:PAS domain S-box-containing protein
MSGMLVDIIDVRTALESDAIVPCFQPIVELRTGRLAGFEVLARWRHPDLGLILPQNFILLAEENGLIGQLTHQILNKSFLAAHLLPEPLFLTVNISPIQLRYLTLPHQIHDVAQDHGFPLQRLIVEITESALVNNLERAQKIAFELNEMGCKLALDDFGTGYSSLTHLQALPFSKLKIDRSFIQSMASRRESRKIVAAVVGLGYSLGMKTVAEGVETEEQADMLLWLGCELAQGWLYGHPLPAEHIPDMVAAAPQTFCSRISSERSKGEIFSLEALPAQRLAQLQAIYNGAPVGLCFLDKDLRYVSLNQRLADLNGAPVSAHIGRTVQEMVPEVFPQVQPYLLRALQGEAISGVEAPKPSPKAGEPDLTVILSYQPAFDEDQDVIGVSVAVMDITDRKIVEKALSESEQEYQHLLELSPYIGWVADADGNLVEISSKWVHLTGLSREQALSRGWLEALHLDDANRTLKAIREALQTGNPFDAEYRVKTADDKWKWMRSRGWPRHAPSGEIIRWYGGVEDIDERKELERTLGKNRACPTIDPPTK